MNIQEEFSISINTAKLVLVLLAISPGIGSLEKKLLKVGKNMPQGFA